MSRPVVCITGAAAAAVLVSPLVARQESGRDAQFFKDQPPAGLVGVWLDAESRKKMATRFPRLAGASAVLLQSPSLAGVDAFEPLYGTRALCHVKGFASGDDADALVVAVRVGAGPIEPIGMPAAFLADSQAALPLLQRLANLGVLKKDLNDGTLAPFCAMLPAVDPRTGLELNASQQSSKPSKELVEFNVVSKSGTGDHLELTGIICPEGFYDATTATCSWTDRADAPSDSSSTADDQGDQDKGDAPEPSSECPLCAFIKGGGCAEAFAPFHACVMEQADAVDRREARKKAAAEGAAQNGDGHSEEKKDGEEKPTPNCMPLFAPVAECMVADGAKREYYQKFIDDFPHLFENRSKAK